MKRLAVLFVLAAVLGVCSQSYGNIYVYNVSGTVKAVDTGSNNVGRTMVRGTLVVDMDETQGTVNDQSFVMYGRNADGNGVYVEAGTVNVTLYGNVVAVVINVQASGDEIILTSNNGRWSRFANMLDGSIHLNGGMLFDADTSLVGAGDITAILDTMQTRNANRNGKSVSDVVNNIITQLQVRGFTELTIDDGGGPLPG